jgi:hypothetical protein
MEAGPSVHSLTKDRRALLHAIAQKFGRKTEHALRIGRFLACLAELLNTIKLLLPLECNLKVISNA